MRFLLDMGVSPRTGEFLRRLGYDVVHLRERTLEKLPDSEIVLLAAAEQRAIVTFDLDFSRILALQELASPSVVLFRLEKFTTDDVNQLLADIVQRFQPALESGAIVVADAYRIRVRRLPIF